MCVGSAERTSCMGRGGGREGTHRGCWACALSLSLSLSGRHGGGGGRSLTAVVKRRLIPTWRRTRRWRRCSRGGLPSVVRHLLLQPLALCMCAAQRPPPTRTQQRARSWQSALTLPRRSAARGMAGGEERGGGVLERGTHLALQRVQLLQNQHSVRVAHRCERALALLSL